MAWQYHPLLVLFALGGIVSFVVAGYCWRYIRTYGRSYLVAGIGLLGFNNAVWVLAATLKTASTDLNTSLLFYKLEFLGFLPNTAVAIVVALAYIGKDRWLTTRLFALLSVAPVAFILLVLANPGNVMIVNPTLIPTQGILAFEHEFPPLFIIHLAYLYGTILVAIVILAWGLATDRIPTVPALTAIAALLIPFVTAVLKTAGIYPPGGDGINITPAASAIGISILAFAIIRYRVFESIPVGRDQAIEVMTDGYLLVNQNGTVLDANPAAAELLMGHSDANLQTKSVTEIMPGSDDLIETTPIDFETDERTVEVRRSDVTRQNQDAGEVLLLRDVTEKRQQEQEIKQKNERLEQFASMISHDLRNPLNVAQGNLRLAQQECSTEHLTAVEDAHERMADLIEDLLTLARKGEMTAERESIDLTALIETTWGTIKTGEATLVSETEQTIRGEPRGVQQLLENLFRNAIEHGGEDITITVGELDDGFYVADDGSGISVEDRETVFEVGYSTGDEGTGFGLKIVQEIVKAHDWEICLTESETGGVRFDVTGVEFAEC